MVIEPKRALNKERVKTKPALAPVNIIVAEFGSNLAYWQPTLRSMFCGLLTNSTGTEPRTFEARKTLSGGLLGTNFRSITEREAKIFKANNTEICGARSASGDSEHD